MRKETNKYFFSVEGKTEKWYFEWLQRTINSNPDALYSVNLDCKIQKDPLHVQRGFLNLEKPKSLT